jgi:hypothetical protein
VADGQRPRKALQNLLFEDLADQAHVLVHANAGAVADRDAGRLLAAMLEREKAKKGHAGSLLVGGVESEYAAFLFRPFLGQVRRWGEAGVPGSVHAELWHLRSRPVFLRGM